MPPKKAASKSTLKTSKKAKATDQESNVACPICVKPVLDPSGENSGHDGLFCEGKCQCWFHRWCAGVTKERYDAISSTDDPFLCPACSMANCQATIATQLADISSLRQSINSLAEEVRELKSTVTSIQSQLQLAVRSNLPQSTKPRDAAGGWSVKAKKPKHQRQQQEEQSHPRSAANLKSTVPVENARKIWGTMKAATSKTVLTAIEHVVPNLNSLTIKRKFQATNGTAKKWWHVVRGSKADIELLDSDWNKIQTQTGWKLQPLLSFSTTISAVPVATNFETTAVPPTVSTNTGATTTTRILLPDTAPVLDLSSYTPVSPQVSSAPLSASSSSISTNNVTVLEPSPVTHIPTAIDSANKEHFLAKSRLPDPPSIVTV